MMNELLVFATGIITGFSACSILSAHKLYRTILAKQGHEVVVQTSKGERNFTLATDLRDVDEYAILWMKPSDSAAPVTFAVKASRVRL